jgi:uncharacterized membrane protein YqjE
MDREDIEEWVMFIFGFIFLLGSILTFLVCIVIMIWTESDLAAKIAATSLVTFVFGLLVGKMIE